MGVDGDEEQQFAAPIVESLVTQAALVEGAEDEDDQVMVTYT